MALTLAQIQAMITNKEDSRQIINEITDYLEANPGGGGGVESVTGDAVDNTDPLNPVINSVGGLLSATIELNDAEIKALPTTSIEIVAAPGAGKYLKIMGGLMISNTSAAAYTNVTGGESLSVTEGNSAYNFYTNTDIFQEEDLVMAELFQSAASNGSPVSAFENLPLTIVCINNLGDLTGGDAANTLKVIVYYIIVDL